MTATCTECNAEFWPDEVPAKGLREDDAAGGRYGFTKCCLKGGVNPPA